MPTPDALFVASAVAQASYASFGSLADVDALVVKGKADFTSSLARRYQGQSVPSSEPFQAGLIRAAYQPDQLNGFSATLFQFRNSTQKVLAIRGTAGPADLLQDANLAITGFASDQLISLYRFY